MANITDGTSNTYMFGEKYLIPDDYFNGEDGSDNECSMVGYDNDGYRCGPSGTVPAVLQDTPGLSDQMRFGSAHPNGVKFVFCDGSVHNISFYIDSVTHSRLCNRQDGQPVDYSKVAPQSAPGQLQRAVASLAATRRGGVRAPINPAVR